MRPHHFFQPHDTAGLCSGLLNCYLLVQPPHTPHQPPPAFLTPSFIKRLNVSERLCIKLDHTSFFFVNSLSFYNCVNSACCFILQEPQCGVTFQSCCTAWYVNWNYGKGHFHVIPWLQGSQIQSFQHCQKQMDDYM